MKDLRKLVVVDVEATCVPRGERFPDGQRQEIIQIGLCTLDLRTYERSDRLSIYVRAHSRCSAFCTQLTGIDDDLLDAEGVEYDQAMARVRDHFDGKLRYLPWASWGAFDRDMFEREARRHLRLYPEEWGSPELVREKYSSDLPDNVYPWSNNHQNMKTWFAMLAGKVDGEFGMERACEIAGVPLEGQVHRADWDAWNTAGVIAWMLRRGRIGFEGFDAHVARGPEASRR